MVFERSINVIIVLQLTIFRSQVHCHLLTNPLEVLHKTGHTHFQYITMGDASTPSSHTSHQVHSTASIGALSWIGPFPLANHVFPIFHNMPATGTSPSVPIFKLLIFLSSAASSELHSFTPILIKCLNFTSSAKPHFLLSVSTSPETSYLQITLPPLLLVEWLESRRSVHRRCITFTAVSSKATKALPPDLASPAPHRVSQKPAAAFTKALGFDEV